MTRSRVGLVLCALLAVSVLAACGGDDDGGGGGAAGTESGTALKEGKRGGTLTFIAAGDVDYLDPGQTYYTFGYTVHYAVNRTLYAFRPNDPVDPVPDLADGKPEISPDNRTITVRIKPGIRYAPPVDREVTSADIKYAFERAFSRNVPSGYAGAYFTAIEGAGEAGAGPIKEIPGIETPDDRTIVFRLSEPQAPQISQALVMPITTPVPEAYAKPFDAKSPSTYDQYVAFTGPYMVRNDAQGKTVGRDPGKQIEIVRNPNWKRDTDFRPAYLDRIVIQEGNDDLAVAARRVLEGESAVCCDSGSPPAQVLRRALQRNKGQVSLTPAGGTRYMALNSTIPPLDDLNVRKAIIAASDRTALRLTRGGEVLGDIANGWIPPGVPGFEEAGGLKQNTDLDFLKNPKGDPALARKYMLAAKEADPSQPIDAGGRWTGDERFLTIASNADPDKKAAEVFQGQMEKLGFRLNFRLVPQDTLYTRFCGVPRVKVAFCPSVSWYRDFSDPQSMLDATFNGDNILQQGNVNWAQLDVPAINSAMKRAATIPVGDERNAAWARIGHQVAEQAPAIPWIWDKTASVQSKNVVGVVSGYYTTHDLSFTSLK